MEIIKVTFIYIFLYIFESFFFVVYAPFEFRCKFFDSLLFKYKNQHIFFLRFNNIFKVKFQKFL